MAPDKKSFPKRTYKRGSDSVSVVSLPDGRFMFLDSKGRDIGRPQTEDEADHAIEQLKALGFNV